MATVFAPAISLAGASEILQATLVTVNAVTADFDNTWPEGRCGNVVAIITATNAARTGIVNVIRSTAYNRPIASAVNQTADTAVVNTNAGLAGIATALQNGPSQMRCRVTGIAGQTLTWRITLLLYNFV